TKSGIVGLLGCALGIARGDQRLQALSEALTMAVRADRSGKILKDYHTIQGERGVVINALGEKRGGNGTILSERYYLQDACFTVMLAGADSVLEECANALRAPCFLLFLGRKCCVPSQPILPILTQRYASLQEAALHYPLAVRTGGELSAHIECEQGAYLRRDQVICSCQYLFGRRHYEIIRVPAEEVDACI
ncbi:MAG: type I-E CRISPR-associated protein Cas5/CasD, partial [Clostridia bacterium]